ncbi:hypothetical protein VTO42DRAFT_3211 [Malbranchea cinnamomea]
MGLSTRPGQPLSAEQRIFLLVLRTLTTMTWGAIARAYELQFSLPHGRVKESDCRTQWSRRLNGPLLLMRNNLLAGQPVSPQEDTLVRAYLQVHGMPHLNELGQAYLAAPASQPAPSVTARMSSAPIAASSTGPLPLPAAPQTAPVNDGSPTQFEMPLQQHPAQFFSPQPYDNFHSLASAVNQPISYPVDPSSGSQTWGQSEHHEQAQQQTPFDYYGNESEDPNGYPQDGQQQSHQTGFGQGPYGGYHYPPPN